eukprot:1159633-Pelagomonas_calceolata.AAC.5
MRRRTADHMPLPLGESQRELIKQVAAASKDPGVAEAATEQDPKAPEPGERTNSACDAENTSSTSSMLSCSLKD